MKPSLTWAVSTACLAYALWRNGRSSRNVLIPTLDFPHSYYAGGSSGGHCTVVKDTLSNDMRYCEDAVFWERIEGTGGAVLDKVLLLSCDPNRKAWNTVMGPLSDPDPRGALWLYDIGDAGARPRRITLEGYPEAHDFHPLGLDVYPSQQQPENDQPYSNLFVVNHARNGSTIEQFVLSWDAPDCARWVRTLSGPDLVAPNALALTSPTSFYLTHDHRFTRRLPGMLGKILPVTESVLALPLGWTTHVTLTDDTPPSLSSSSSSSGTHQSTTHTTTIAASRIPFANGIAISPDGAQVAIASTSLCEILFYARASDDNDDDNDDAATPLSLRARVPTPFAPDNIMFDSRGSLIVAGHPHFPSLVAVAANQTGAHAPSWVVSITPAPRLTDAKTRAEEGEQRRGHVWDVGVPVPASRKVPPVPGYEMRTLYQSDGSAFSSSSTALRDAETGVLYIVGLYEEGLMVCSP